MNNKYISLIFCQSAIKVSSVLVCYEYEMSKGHDVIIIVRNAKTIFDFIVSLKLNAKVYWFESYPNNLSSLVKRKKLRRFINDQLSVLNLVEVKISRIYFTSICNDLPMCSYLARFPKDKIIKIQGALDIKNGIDNYNLSAENYPLKYRVIKALYSFLLNYRLRLQMVVTPTLAIDIGYYRYPLFDGSDMSVCNRYLYSPKETNIKSALVFASEYVEIFPDRKDYVDVFISCILRLKEVGYKVYIKGHPRLGVLNEAIALADTIIPAYIPAEFIDYSFFKMAFGLTTSAICSTAFHIPSYSLLPLTKLGDDVRYQGWCDYLNNTSDNKVKYLKTLDEIK